MRNRFWKYVLLLGAVIPLAAAASAGPQAAFYPSRPIRIIVPFSPQGPNDILARLVGQKLSDEWHQQVVVENRPGGGTVVGTDVASHAPADGYTLLMVSTSTATNPSLKKLPYDTFRDFTPVIRLAESPNVLVVHPALPVHSVAELIGLAKSKPRAIAYASGGVGTATHLAGELLCIMGRVKMTHVPYKGAGPATIDLLSGQVSWMFGTILPTMPHIEAKKLRPIAVSGLHRSPALPGVPTVADTLPGFNATSWYGIFAPAHTPPEIVTKLNGEIAKLLNIAELKEQLKRQGVEATPDTPEAFAQQFKAEVKKWGDVVRALHIGVN